MRKETGNPINWETLRNTLPHIQAAKRKKIMEYVAREGKKEEERGRKKRKEKKKKK